MPQSRRRSRQRHRAIQVELRDRQDRPRRFPLSDGRRAGHRNTSRSGQVLPARAVMDRTASLADHDRVAQNDFVCAVGTFRPHLARTGDQRPHTGCFQRDSAFRPRVLSDRDKSCITLREVNVNRTNRTISTEYK